MASDKPQSEILDLLYDDELDDETRAAARRDVEQSDEAREELEAYEAMLAKIREADVGEDVPSSVHDSIMAAARKHTANNASRQAQVTRRAPTTSKPTKHSLWSRLNSSGVSQLVLAAAVVLVGGFIFIKIGDRAPDQAFMAADESVEQEVSFGSESSNKFAKKAPAPEQPAEPVEQQLAQAPRSEVADNEVDANEAQPSAEEVPTAKKSEVGELARLTKSDQAVKRAKASAPRGGAGQGGVGQESKREDRNRARTRRVRKSASRRKSDDDQIELFGAPARTQRKSRPAPRAAEKQEAALDEVLEDSASASNRSSSSTAAGVSDGAALGKSLGNLADSSAESESAGATSGPVPTQQTEGSQEQTSSVSTMESNYRSGNFAGVVTQADRYLSGSSGDKTDEARVLELKARALARQGKTNEADGVYAELQKKYPSYKSDQIRRERADLTKERKSKAKRRRQAPAEAKESQEADSYQEMDEMRPSSIETEAY